MDAGGLDLKFMYEVLKDRPDLFLSIVLLLWAWSERSERKNLQTKLADLVNKMQEQNSDTNELLGQIKFLLDILTRGRFSA